MTKFKWEEYDDVLFMLILGIEHDTDLINVSKEKLQERIDKELTERFGDEKHARPISLFNKRDILIPHTYKNKLGTESKGLYSQYVKATKEYYAGNYSEALSLTMKVHVQVLGLPSPEEHLFLAILLSDNYLLMANSFEASPLCLECAYSTDLPPLSPIRGAALSMLGDIAFRKRHYSIALLKYHEAKDVWKSNSQFDSLSITRSDICRTFFYLGKYAEAFSEMAEAITTAKRLKNPDSLAYCLLTEIEMASLMRDTSLAKTKLEEYNNIIASNSNLSNSHWEMLILSRYYVERSDFKECLKELLHACLFLKQFNRHEHMPDAMVMLASYLNYEGAYDNALSCLLECYELYPELKSYRFALFLQWLHTLETTLRGNDNTGLANAASTLIVKFLHNDIMEVKNTILGRTSWWQNLTLLDKLIDELRGLTPRFFSRYGLRINLNSGEIYKESQLEPVHILTKGQTKVFRQFALNPGVAFKNLEIIRSYQPKMAEYYDANPDKKAEIPRKDNHYIPLFRKLFTRLCGNRMIENLPGSGYYIPEL